MGIADEDVARVRAATDIVAVAGEQMALRRVGRRWVGLCPFHPERTPSFSLNAELGLYYCFGCGAKGDAITFVRETEHLEFVEAVEKLAARAGITLRYDERGGGKDQQRRSRLYEVLAAAEEWYHARLLHAPDASAARAYLRRERGYDGDVVRRYRLGWAPDGRDELVRELVRALGVPAGTLADAGLAHPSGPGRYADFFRGRLLFPVFDPGGRPVGFGGRALPGGPGPKYKNTPATAVYEKGRVLYGLNWAKKAVVERGRVVVCEGYTDVVGLQQAGVEEAVATCGTALAEGHVRLLTNFARRIVLAYDADSAGQAAAERFYDWEQRLGADIRVALLPAGADPADLAASDPDELRRAVDDARTFLAFRLERLLSAADLSTAEGRARAAAEAAGVAAGHPNELVRDQYLMQVADRCRLQPGQLRALARSPRARPSRPHPADGPAPRPPRVEVPAAELEALRLAVHRPGDVADRLETALFGNPLAAAAFGALASATTLHEAVEGADPETADLLQRAAVEEAVEEPDDVVTRLVERAARRALGELQAELRAARPEDQAGYGPVIGWLKLAVEALRPPEAASPDPDRDAERVLVDWLVARYEAQRPHGGDG